MTLYRSHRNRGFTSGVDQWTCRETIDDRGMTWRRFSDVMELWMHYAAREGIATWVGRYLLWYSWSCDTYLCRWYKEDSGPKKAKRVAWGELSKCWLFFALLVSRGRDSMWRMHNRWVRLHYSVGLYIMYGIFASAVTSFFLFFPFFITQGGFSCPELRILWETSR